MKTLLILLFIAVLIALPFVPLAIIWALNTLFPLAIPYTFWTWLAVVVLNLTWMGKAAVNRFK